uniref:NTR domain-containing protein n=1 Tax=Scophthalmus maximus TaxID=52904 RepID=A0A8D3CF85_SCOMX
MTTLSFLMTLKMRFWRRHSRGRQSLSFLLILIPPSCPLLVSPSAESDFTHDAFCMSECRKEKEEREYYCYSEFAVNGIVHDIEVLRKGIWLITLMVSSDGFYKMSRLYVAPDSFFFKVRLLVLDTYKCSKPCPDIKLGARYIIMGQIYHRRRHLPNGLLRSNNYVKRFNKRRHQKALEATRSRCR